MVFVNARNAETTLQLTEDLKNTTWIDAIQLSEIQLKESLNMKPFEFLILKDK